jgi:flagellar hook-associated protein 3 FlgL
VRITDKMIFEGANTHSARARSEAELATAQAATGLRVEHAWDDPGAAGLVVNHRLASGRFTTIGETVRRASDEMVAADGALGRVNEILTRGRELAVQLANPTYSAEDRATAAKEADALHRETVALLNTRFGNRYLFAGYIDNVAPFDSAGNYLGDAGVRRVEIAPGVAEDASVRADIFAKGAGGGVDILATISSLSTALTGNDANGIRATLDAFDTSISQVATARSQIGSSMNLFDLAAETARLASDGEKTSAARLTEIDPIEAASKLALAQRALDASLTAAARSFDLTLLNKLR